MLRAYFTYKKSQTPITKSMTPMNPDNLRRRDLSANFHVHLIVLPWHRVPESPTAIPTGALDGPLLADRCKTA